MWFKHRAWIPVAWAAAAANLVGFWFVQRLVAPEPWHATIHAFLAAGFALGALRLRARQRQRALPGAEQWQETLELNEQLQQTVDAMQEQLHALEERVDFAERLLATHRNSERIDAPPREP